MEPVPGDVAGDDVEGAVETAVDEALAVLRSMRGVWDEEAVDELDHALQCGGRALALRPGDDAFVVAALLHDVAHAPALADQDHDQDQDQDQDHGPDHAAVARAWLTPRFGARTGWLAGAHVVAKRHLARTEPAYAAGLSPTSTTSLARQGGPEPVDASWTRHPWWSDALALRRCDDAAKVPGAPAPSPAELTAVLRRAAATRGGPGW